MRREDYKSAIADFVSLVADDFRLGWWEGGDLAVVLLILSVAVGNDSCDLVFDVCRKGFNGLVRHSSALTVLFGILLVKPFFVHARDQVLVWDFQWIKFCVRVRRDPLLYAPISTYHNS